MELKACEYICRICALHILFTLNIMSTCPTDSVRWMKRSRQLNCTKELPYHCGFTEHDTLQEFCSKPRTLPSKYCPVFKMNSTIISRLWNCTHYAPMSTEKCVEQNLPRDEFVSDELYKYPVCFLGEVLQTLSTKDLPSKPQITSESNNEIHVTTSSISSNVSVTGILNTTHSSRKPDKNNNGSNIQISNAIIITFVSAIVAFFIIALGMNITVFWFLNSKNQQTFSSNEIQNEERISNLVVAYEGEVQDANMYECINELAIQPSVLEENENMDDYDNDDTDNPYNHLKSNRHIKMEGVNHACSAL